MILKKFGVDLLVYPKCKIDFEAPLEMILEFEEEDAFNGLPISTPILDYKSKRCFHHKYHE